MPEISALIANNESGLRLPPSAGAFSFKAKLKD